MAITAVSATGIRDPARPGCWLVTPWQNEASFCELVSHFLIEYVRKLQGETSAARLYVYFAGYATALEQASTDELSGPAAWQWRDELLAIIAECVHLFSERTAVESQQDRWPSHPSLSGTRTRVRSVADLTSR